MNTKKISDFPKISSDIRSCLDLFDVDPNKLDDILISENSELKHAGCWDPINKIILLNKFIIDIFPEYYDEILYHEIGHAISHLLWGNQGSGHGVTWKEVMLLLGQKPSISFPNHYTSSFQCSTCKTPHPYSIEILNRIRMGRFIRCIHCNHFLRLTQEMMLRYIKS